MLPYSKYFTGLIIIIIANIYSIYYVPGTILITYVCVCILYTHAYMYITYTYLGMSIHTHALNSHL